ncbi:MAG: hypothetical protein E7055_05995 [Lentisphaerae bacterium]|nr:hypothetical protein [Lentisphaerota bacterium]
MVFRMKQIFILLIFVCGLYGLSAPVEMLGNRDFSQLKNGNPVGWRINNAGKFQVCGETGNFDYVKHAWGYNMLYSTGNAVHLPIPGQPAAKGGTYRLSVRAKGKGRFQLAVMLQKGSKGNWKFIRTAASKSFVLSNEYSDYEWKYTVSDPAVKLAQFSILLWSASRMEFREPSMTFDPDENPSIADPGFELPRKLTDTLPLPTLKLPLTGNAPVLDGEYGDREYHSGIRLLGVMAPGSPIQLPTGDHITVASDGESLFIALKSPVSREKLKNYDGKDIFFDAAEILINPGTRQKPADRVYQLLVDGSGQIAGFQCDWRKTSGRKSWKVQGVKTASQVKDGFWTLECSIPLRVLGIDREQLFRGIGILVCRDWSNLASGVRQSQFNFVPKNGAYDNPETIPEFQWSESAPAISEQLPEQRKNHELKICVSNPSKKTRKVLISYIFRPQFSQPTTEEKIMELTPGGSAVYGVKAIAPVHELCYCRIKVSSVDRRTVWFEREFYRQQDNSGKIFRLRKESGVKLRYGFFPSSMKMASEIDFAAAQPADAVKKIRQVELQVADPAGKVIARTAAPVVSYALARKDNWQLPVLAPGKYHLRASFGNSGIAPVTGDFTYRKFEWENNRIGMSDQLLPGFTPVKLHGMVYETVLRSHLFNSAGLYDSIKSMGHELLAGPMTLFYEADGRGGRAVGKKLEWEKITPTCLKGKGTVQLGALTTHYEVTAEYDGFMKWEFFYPAGKLDKLRLEIPIRASEVRLMHTLTDALRGQYSGKIPVGQGIVWRGSRNYRREIPSPFVPYIWLGGIERGLSVSSPSDKNWSAAPGAETQELRHEGDRLTLVVHLASVPVTGDGKKSIKLCFQATPVKARPPDFRKYTFGIHEFKVGKKYNMPLLGQGRYWGAETSCTDIFPRGRDMSVLYKLREARDTGRIDHPFFEKWLAGYKQFYATAADPVELEKMKKRFRTDLLAYPLPMLTSLKPRNIIFYTNGRGVRLDTPEAETYLNEWCRTRFPKRRWGYAGGDPYILDPVASYRDFAAWYLKQMSLAFMDIVYIDDIFQSPNFNMESSEAWRDVHGKIHPDSGLFNMRELVRRASMLIHEQNRPVLTMTHMTDTALMPVLSFAYTQYCWEFGQDARFYQERTTRESIQTVDTGRQAGTISFGLIMLGRCTAEEKRRIERSAIGVALTHDIKLYSYVPLYRKLLQILFDFGYGEPEVPVHVYYQENYPLKITGIDSSSLAVSKGKNLLLLICDWKDGGTAKVVPDPSLGLGTIVSAIDLETGEKMAVGNNAVEIPVRKYDFRILKISGK